MVIGKILRGESKNVELKEALPKNSESYTRTVVAFANTQGGQIVFGVADGTRKIVGIDEEILFQTMDSIANAVSDSCEPQIVPSIEPYTVEGKTIVLVTVVPEPHRPYYLKSKGKDKGTYIRVGGTTRPAGPEKIKELEMEGARISWDELICVGYKVTESAIKKLCRDMNIRRKDMQGRGNSMQRFPAVTRVNLENWKVLKKADGEYLASNAFVLLTSDYFQFSRTQCAVFKGKDRSVFLDKREYTGPIYEQIEEALQFVLRNIRLGAEIVGIQRKEAYELPVDAVREMIINAHCHRNMREESCVQVAIYDDRLEVTSPGGLYNGLTFEEAMQGHSKIRNRVIANILSQIGFVEAWGTGLQRIKNSADAYGLPAPEFIEMPESFRVNLFRKPLPADIPKANGDASANAGDVGDVGDVVSAGDVGVMSEKAGDVGENADIMPEDAGENSGAMPEDAGDVKKSVLKIIHDNDKVSAKGIAQIISVSQRTVERYIKELREEGELIRRGSARGGFWEVVKEKSEGENC